MRAARSVADMAARALGRSLHSYLKRLSARCEVVGDRALYPCAVEGTRHFFCYRNQDVVALALSLCLPPAESLFRNVEFVCDDSFGGCIAAALTDRLDLRVRWLHRAPFAQRALDLQDLIRAGRSIGIAVDTGGPYGHVGEALPRLAKRCNARLVPLIAIAAPALPLRRHPRISLPLPGAALALAVGESVAADAPEDARRDLQQSLDRAEQRARAFLAGDFGARASR